MLLNAEQRFRTARHSLEACYRKSVARGGGGHALRRLACCPGAGWLQVFSAFFFALTYDASARKSKECSRPKKTKLEGGKKKIDE
jgi:hypothetical protein